MAIIIISLHEFSDWFDLLFLDENGPCQVGYSCLDEESLSNIRHNIWILFFAVFGGGLAIWARAVNQKQLEKSIQMNRDERFAKAAEMLNNTKDGKAGDKISVRGGLYILETLINECPKTEYIRCVEIISYWIVSYFNSDDDKKNTKKNAKESAEENTKESVNIRLSNVVAQILKIRSDHKELENIIKKYKKDNNLGYWPFLKYAKLSEAFLKDVNLQGASLPEVDLGKAILENANLQGARLRKANLENADLHGAKLKGANLTNANMKNVKGLTKDNIRLAKWFIVDDDGNISGGPPTLPVEWKNVPEVKEWLRKDSNGTLFNHKKSKAKKAKTKEPKN